jgi:rod shape-determining protein MreC
MQQIFNFIVRFKTGLTFLLLLSLALFLTIEAHTYHSSKWISSTNFITGSIFELNAEVTDYFGLKSENNKLVKENTRLRNKLLNLQENVLFFEDSLITKDTTYLSYPVKLIANSYLKSDNYLLLNKGNKDGIQENMGVISSLGIVGIVEETTGNYTRVISILNSNISINAKLKKSNHFGSLIWNGKNPNLVSLVDVPRSAKISIGDSIVTGGNSLIFPENLPIGKIDDFQLNPNQGYYDITIELFNDMTSLKNLYVIQFNSYKEASLLLEKIEEDE